MGDVILPEAGGLTLAFRLRLPDIAEVEVLTGYRLSQRELFCAEHGDRGCTLQEISRTGEAVRYGELRLEAAAVYRNGVPQEKVLPWHLIDFRDELLDADGLFLSDQLSVEKGRSIHLTATRIHNRMHINRIHIPYIHRETLEGAHLEERDIIAEGQALRRRGTDAETGKGTGTRADRDGIQLVDRMSGT